MARFKREVVNPTVRAVMDLTSEQPERWVPLREVESVAGRSPAQAKADLAGLTRLVTRSFKRQNWPMRVESVLGRNQQAHYHCLSEDHARWWRDSR